MVALSVKHLCKDYVQEKLVTKVLKDISFDVNQGDFLMITGPSGSGKTTLLNCISGLDNITSGDIYIGNKILSGLKNQELSNLRKASLGFVFQSYNLLPDLTLFENVKLTTIISNKDKDDEIIKLFKEFNLDKYLNYFPTQVSGGMQQRCSIIRAMINDPEIIFADEPTGNLDVESSKDVINCFVRLNKEYHKTIIMVTHSMDLLQYATRNIHIVDGMVKFDKSTC